jgi:parallel beta-helix repeat protein
VDGVNDDARVQGSVISLAAPSLAPTAGIQFSNGASGTVENSDVSGNDRGVWLSGVGEVTVSESYAHDNGEGLSVDSRSRGNLFAANYALHNTRYDCVDRSRGSGTAGTANRWRRSNHGEHNLPQPICKP